MLRVSDTSGGGEGGAGGGGAVGSFAFGGILTAS